MTRSRMKRTGSIASAGVLVSAGLFGAYVGNPRLQRAYAFPTCASPTYDDTVSDQTDLISALKDPDCIRINVLGQISLDDSITIYDNEWSLGWRDDSGLTITGVGGGDDSIGGSSSGGIVIAVDDTDMEVSVSNLTLDNFSSSSTGGAALTVRQNSVAEDNLLVTLTDDTFAHNVSTYFRSFPSTFASGAVQVWGDDTTSVVIHNSRFTYNTNIQANNSGALLVRSTQGAARVDVYNSHFANNDGHVGGAMRVVGADGSYVNSYRANFIHNEAAEYGGAILTDSARIVESLFDENSSGSKGGAIKVTDGPLEIFKSTFTGNSVSQGNGGAIHSQGTLTVGHSLISDNWASTRGGGIAAYYVSPDDTATITHSTISDDTSAAGGGMLLSGLDTTIEYSSIVGNSATVAGGGGIYAYDSDLTLRNTYVGGNDSVDAGGGILTYEQNYSANLTLLFSTVYDDTTLSLGPPAASEVFVYGSLYARGSVVGRRTNGHAMYVRDGINSVDSISTYSTPQPPAILDDSVNFDDSVPPGGLFLTRDDTTVPGRTGASPSGNSPLVLQAADDSLGVLPLSLDQWQIARSNYDTYTIGARQFVTTPTPPNPPVPPGPPLDSPSEPRDVRAAAAGDRRATVSWTAPAYAGAGPVTAYLVTSSPGGKTCATVAPTVSCTVSGLDNGTTYTFTVRAQNDYGSSLPSAASNPVTPQAESPTPVPVPPVPTGGSSLLVDGQTTPGLRVVPNARQDGVDITGPGFTMTLAGLGPDGKSLPLADDSVLQVIPGAQSDVGGTGFAAGTEVGIFLDPPPLVRSAMSGLVQRALGASSPITLGTLKVKADGTFAGTLPIPADLPLGSHVLQAAGYSPSGQTRAVSIGILAIAPKTPSIVVTGTRDGRTVKVRGATQGLTSSTVVPRYHFAGQVKYKTGIARPTIDTSGNFTWSRKTGRTIYLYFAADGTRSNRLVLRRVG